MKKILLAFIIYIMAFNSFGQSFFKKTKKEAEAGIMFSSSGKNPFWIRSNQYGAIPFESNNVFLKAAVHKEYDSLYRISGKLNKVAYGYGAGIVGNAGKVNQFLLQELYLKGRWRAFEMYAGRRKEIYGLVDSTLSSGSYIWSGNALPMPKVEISIPNYVSIIGKGIVAIKGSFAHGWFGNQVYTDNYYLHQKALYGRIGRESWKVNFFGGVNNQIQWGGYSETYKDNSFVSLNGHFASDFNAFLGSAFPFPYIRKNFPAKIQVDNDNMNYGGNVLGSVDFAVSIKSKNIYILAYRQLPYELGTLFTSLTNADDGLYGVSLKFTQPKFSIKKIVIEGFHSYNQGYYQSRIAKILGLKDEHYGEIQYYLNHGQYLDGWVYNHKEIGTPLIVSNNEISNTLDITSNLGNNSTYNQVKLVYLGIEGVVQRFNYELKTSYGFFKSSNNYYKSFDPKYSQFSISTKVNYLLKNNYRLHINLAADSGKFLTNSFGGFLSISKTWY